MRSPSSDASWLSLAAEKRCSRARLVEGRRDVELSSCRAHMDDFIVVICYRSDGLSDDDLWDNATRWSISFFLSMDHLLMGRASTYVGPLLLISWMLLQ